MKFELIFHPEARKELSSLDGSMKARVVDSLTLLELQGNKLRFPHTRLIKDGLFELRVGNKDITRTFFAYEKDRKIYILRTFVKKTQKTPTKEIDLAFKRLEETKLVFQGL